LTGALNIANVIAGDVRGGAPGHGGPMIGPAIASDGPGRSPEHWQTRRLAPRGAAAVAVLAWLAGVGMAAAAPSEPAGKGALDTITVEAKRQRAVIEQQVKTFVSAIAVAPWQKPLKRWRTPICPLVAGLPHDQGEFILAHVSQIAASAGAPLAPEHCQANLYVVLTSKPDELLKAWSKRDPDMFGAARETQIRRFINASTPVRVWYNANLIAADGSPLFNYEDVSGGIPENRRAEGYRLSYDEVAEISSALVLVDARRAKGVNYGQLADYIAMVGLAELRLDADMGDALTVLSLFSAPGKAPSLGLSAWDQAFLKALYHTDQRDKMQLAEIKTSVVRDVAP
jgi:hypothetical protein